MVWDGYNLLERVLKWAMNGYTSHVFLRFQKLSHGQRYKKTQPNFAPKLSMLQVFLLRFAAVNR